MGRAQAASAADLMELFSNTGRESKYSENTEKNRNMEYCKVQKCSISGYGARGITMADVLEAKRSLVDLTAEIVAAYVAKNTVAQTELPKLIGEVHRALSGAISQPPVREDQADAKPAVAIKKSLTADYLICLEDGKKFKSLKRHLRSHYNLSPEQYREKWGLPADYPMVAPNYAQARSSLAKRMGLGQRKSRK